MATHSTYRDTFIDKGSDFEQTIEISVNYAEYDFSGSIKSSYSSVASVPFSFGAVANEPKKVKITISSNNTSLLKRNRGVYDIFATNKISGVIHKEMEGQAHFNSAVTIEDAPILLPAETDANVITIKRGQPLHILLSGLDEAGLPYLIPSDWSAVSRLVKLYPTGPEALVFAPTIENGHILIDQDTANLEPGNYYFDVKILDESDSVVNVTPTILLTIQPSPSTP